MLGCLAGWLTEQGVKPFWWGGSFPVWVVRSRKSSAASYPLLLEDNPAHGIFDPLPRAVRIMMYEQAGGHKVWVDLSHRWSELMRGWLLEDSTWGDGYASL